MYKLIARRIWMLCFRMNRLIEQDSQRKEKVRTKLRKLTDIIEIEEVSLTIMQLKLVHWPLRQQKTGHTGM